MEQLNISAQERSMIRTHMFIKTVGTGNRVVVSEVAKFLNIDLEKVKKVVTEMAEKKEIATTYEVVCPKCNHIDLLYSWEVRDQLGTRFNCSKCDHMFFLLRQRIQLTFT